MEQVKEVLSRETHNERLLCSMAEVQYKWDSKTHKSSPTGKILYTFDIDERIVTEHGDIYYVEVVDEPGKYVVGQNFDVSYDVVHAIYTYDEVKTEGVVASKE